MTKDEMGPLEYIAFLRGELQRVSENRREIRKERDQLRAQIRTWDLIWNDVELLVARVEALRSGEISSSGLRDMLDRKDAEIERLQRRLEFIEAVPVLRVDA